MPEQKQIFYEGDLNTKRIAAYRKLSEEYNISESSVRDIFCKGLDFAVQTLPASPAPVDDKDKDIERLKDGLRELIKAVDKHQPQVDLSDQKQLDLYHARHIANKIIEPEKYPNL